jgi:FHS family L-fucose permease-like MFS transporter
MKKPLFAIVLVTSLFFLWGFAHNLDPILIPHLKRSFTLTTVQATLVDSAVFLAYFVLAIPAGMMMKKFGYKTGIIVGLLIFSAGCYLFLPAANAQSYHFFLAALFIIACGLTILETAANPYITALGDPKTATFRLNLAQSFNGLATTLAPIIGAKLILVEGVSDQMLSLMPPDLRQSTLAAEAGSVKMPYFILGTTLLFIALLFIFIKLPVIQREPTVESERKTIFHALKHRHLSWAVLAQFFYVGAQVSIFSLFILYATSAASITETQAANFLGVCGAAFLAGRFLSTFLMRYVDAASLLWIYAVINVVLCVAAIQATGLITVYVVIAICFFMSIMFPTIFALGIKNLGRDTEYGSSLIIMSIVGGAILPRLFGYISDQTGNIQHGYIVPLICFLVVALFGYKQQQNKKTIPLPQSVQPI